MLEVRDLHEGDRDDWRRLWDGYNAFYGRSGATALPEEVVRTTWERITDGGVPVHGLAGALDGEMVAIAHFVFHPSTTDVGPVCYLQDLFTVEAARGRGAGRALIDEVASRARAAGATRLYWHTHESNVTAQALYDQLAERPGFTLYLRTT